MPENWPVRFGGGRLEKYPLRATRWPPTLRKIRTENPRLLISQL